LDIMQKTNTISFIVCSVCFLAKYIKFFVV